jgi:hypothetical protein
MNGWEWISLTPYSQHRERYYALQVDQRGRLWLEGDIYDDFFVRVYDVLPKGLYEIVEYNRYNSNLGTESAITLGPDGKMWVAGDTVAYIDSNAPTLPKPLPDWLAFFGTITGEFVILFILICAGALMFVVQRQSVRKT